MRFKVIFTSGRQMIIGGIGITDAFIRAHIDLSTVEKIIALPS